MLITIALLTMLAAPDAGLTQLETQATARGMRAELDADVALMSPAGQRLALSASLCADEARLGDIRISLARDPLHMPIPLVAAYQETVAAIESAESALLVLEVERQSCSESDVDRVAQCLAYVAPRWCDLDQVIAGQVVAAERLRAVRR